MAESNSYGAIHMAESNSYRNCCDTAILSENKSTGGDERLIEATGLMAERKTANQFYVARLYVIFLKVFDWNGFGCTLWRRDYSFLLQYHLIFHLSS
ncbi:unnamed protein product [Rhodiola kirilowii]